MPDLCLSGRSKAWSGERLRGMLSICGGWVPNYSNVGSDSEFRQLEVYENCEPINTDDRKN
jgi:hypothetical protein